MSDVKLLLCVDCERLQSAILHLIKGENCAVKTYKWPY